MDIFFLFITYTGGPIIISAVTIISCILLVAHKHKKKALELLIAVLGSSITVFLLKFIFNVPRPLESYYYESLPAFPSGHAAAAAALYGFVFFTIWKHEKHPIKNKSLLLLSLLIALIGISRIYLGVHYVTDVIVGYFVGFLWIFISTKIISKKR